MKYLFLVACFILITTFLPAQVNKPVRVIFDTDMGPDYDDVGAITILHAFADSGKADILATIASTKYEGVAAVLNVLNTYFNKPGIPIGVPGLEAVTKKDWQHWTDTLIAKYPHSIKNNSEVPDAVSLYREVLAKQPDRSVTIITVGFLTNISNLLQSKPDKYSSLNGHELVKKKVLKLVCMAGKFPSGKEFNVEQDAKASIYTYNNFPGNVLFSGFEIGQKIHTGLPLINNETIRDSPVKDVFRICIPMDKQDSAGRMSWDETAVLVGLAGYHDYYTTVPGRMIVNPGGSNSWNPNAAGHSYLVEAMPVIKVQDYINNLIMHQPRGE